MGDDKKQWSNVIIGPWESKATQKGKTRDQVIQEEMDAIDDLSPLSNAIRNQSELAMRSRRNSFITPLSASFTIGSLSPS